MTYSKKELLGLIEESKPYRIDNPVLPIAAISPVYSEGYFFQKKGIPEGTNHRILISSKHLLEGEGVTRPEETLIVALIPRGPFSLGIERRETILQFPIYDDIFQEFIGYYQNKGLLYDCNLEDSDPTCFAYIRNLASTVSRLQEALLNRPLMQKWRDRNSIDQSLIQILREITKETHSLDWPDDIKNTLEGNRYVPNLTRSRVRKLDCGDTPIEF